MIVYLFFLIFILVFIKDLRKGIIIYAPFKFVFSYGIPSYVGNLKLDTLFTFLLFCVWLCKYSSSLKEFPLKNSFTVVIIGALIYAFNPVFAITVLLDKICPYIYLLMFYWAIKDVKDLKLFIKTIVAYIFVLNINALFEWAGNNVIGNILHSAMVDNSTYWADDVVSRGIYVRLHSFVPHSIGFGVENMIFFTFFLMIYLYGKHLCNTKIIIFTMICCSMGIFLSGSRSPLLGGIIILIPLILNKNLFNRKNLAFTIALSFILITFAWGYLVTMFESFSSDSTADMGGASSFDMRLMQLEYSVYYWMQNFWFGNGHRFDMFEGGRSSIFGAESVWFPIMMREGVIGLVCYAYVYIDAFLKSKKATFKSICLFLMVGWFVIDSATNLPGLNILLPLYFYVIYYKWSKIDRNAIVNRYKATSPY